MSIHAYIDSQNLHKSVESLGKEIDYKRFRLWLKNKKGIDRAFMFFGYVGGKRSLYDHLAKCGFELVFRGVEYDEGRRRANIDICLTIAVLDRIEEFEEAFLVTSDGDFFDLVERLKDRQKFGGVISPQCNTRCSKLLRRAASSKIMFIPDLIGKFEKR